MHELGNIKELEESIEFALKHRLSYKQRRDLIMVLLDIKFWRFENGSTEQEKSFYLKEYEELEKNFYNMKKN